MPVCVISEKIPVQFRYNVNRSALHLQLAILSTAIRFDSCFRGTFFPNVLQVGPGAPTGFPKFWYYCKVIKYFLIFHYSYVLHLFVKREPFNFGYNLLEMRDMK